MIESKITIPEKVSAEMAGDELLIKGPKGELKRSFIKPQVSVSVNDNKIIVKSPGSSRKFKRVINSIVSHVKNMFKGVQEHYVYKLKVCYQHFPMSIKVQGESFVIENFYGEKKPRKARIMPGVKVQVDGSSITVSGPDKELTGQTAANIELSTRITKRDKRIFQDGIWIISKGDDNGL